MIRGQTLHLQLHQIDCEHQHLVSLIGSTILAITCHQCGLIFSAPVAWHTASYPGIYLQKDTQL